MQKRMLFYLLEAGLIWLREHDGIMSGWESLPCSDATPREIAVIEFGGIEFHIFFCHAEESWPGRVKWLGRIPDARAEYFNPWGLPLARMQPWEAKHLPDLIREFGIKPDREIQASQAA